MAPRRQIVRHLPARGFAQACERDVRNVLPPLGFESKPLQQALLLGLQLKERRHRRDRGDDRTRLAAAEGGQSVEPQLERPPLNAAKKTGNVARQRIIDVADEAQCQMIIFRVDPARPWQTAAHHRKRVGYVPRYFKTCKQTGHDTCGPKSGKLSTNRSRSSMR